MPAFFLLLFIGIILLWFLISGIFKPLGKFVSKIGKDTIDILNEKEKENN